MLPTGSHIPITSMSRQSRTIGEMFWRRCRHSAPHPAMYQKDPARPGDGWIPITWAEFYDRAARVAGGLVALGLAPGERSAVLGPTRAPWAIYDLGAQLAGLVSFGIYPQQTVE